MYNGAQTSCVKILKRGDCLAVTDITNWKVSVKWKKPFAKVRLKFLINCAAKCLQNFCLMSRSYQVVEHGVI